MAPLVAGAGVVLAAGAAAPEPVLEVEDEALVPDRVPD